jgi:hypothetical protein
MNNAVLIVKLRNWMEQLAEKDFQQFTPTEQKEMKKDYVLGAKEAEGYGTGAEITITVKEFANLVGDMEGFFYETVQ